MFKIDFYQVLGVEKDSSQDEIKKAYQKRVLQIHPDKKGESVSNEFLILQKAFETLRDPHLRKGYDLQLKERNARFELPLFCEIDLNEMDFFEDNKKYHFPCRCGGDGFFILEEELEQGIDRTSCGTCSLMIKILFERVEDSSDEN